MKGYIAGSQRVARVFGQRDGYEEDEKDKQVNEDGTEDSPESGCWSGRSAVEQVSRVLLVKGNFSLQL